MLRTDGGVPSGVGMTAAAGLGRGERAPDMVLASRDGTPTRYYAHAGGRPALLVFADQACVARLDALAEGLGAIGDADLTVHVVGRPSWPATTGRFRCSRTPTVVPPPPTALGAHRPPSCWTRTCGSGGAAVGRRRRVATDVAELVTELVWDDRRPRRSPPRRHCWSCRTCSTRSSAPSSSTCGSRRATARPGWSPPRVVGAPSNAQLKRRRDHVVQDPQRSRELAATIGRRVLPELSKAFAYRASRFEGFKIACYQASDGGFFRAHRDNLSPTTAHRRFALTLNLNDGYQGGQLRPEYGPELYRPAAGAALLFSCSHLHEVLEVTAGRRFVLLSFLFGEEARRSE